MNYIVVTKCTKLLFFLKKKHFEQKNSIITPDNCHSLKNINNNANDNYIYNSLEASAGEVLMQLIKGSKRQTT